MLAGPGTWVLPASQGGGGSETASLPAHRQARGGVGVLVLRLCSGEYQYHSSTRGCRFSDGLEACAWFGFPTVPGGNLPVKAAVGRVYAVVVSRVSKKPLPPLWCFGARWHHCHSRQLSMPPRRATSSCVLRPWGERMECCRVTTTGASVGRP